MSRHLLALLALLLLSLALAALALGRAPELVVRQEFADAPAPPLAEGRRLSQTIVAAADDLAFIELLLGTYMTTPDGQLNVTLRLLGAPDGTAVTLAEWVLPGGRIEDNEWRRFHLPWPRDVPAGSVLEMELYRDEPGGRPVTVWTGTGDPYPPGELTVREADGTVTAGGSDMAFRAGYRRSRMEAARARLQSTGLPVPVAGSLLVGLFALPMAFIYTYRLVLAER
ncbi:MAG: hypothetical protein ACK2T6_07460 [Anaerolineae bacterium]